MDKNLEYIWENKYKFLGSFFLVFTLFYILLVAVDFLPEPVEGDGPKMVDPVTQIALTAEANDEAVEVITVEEATVTINNVTSLPISVVSNNPQASEEVLETNNPQVQEVSLVEAETVLPVDTEVTVVGEEAVMPTAITIPKLNKTITVLNPVSRTIADLDAALLSGVVRHPDSATLDQEGNVFILGHSSYLPNVFNKNFQAFNGIEDLAWGDKIEVMSDGILYEYRVEKVYKASALDTTVPIAGTGHKLTLATCNSFGSLDDRFIVEAKRVNVTSS